MEHGDRAAYLIVKVKAGNRMGSMGILRRAIHHASDVHDINELDFVASSKSGPSFASIEDYNEIARITNKVERLLDMHRKFEQDTKRRTELLAQRDAIDAELENL